MASGGKGGRRDGEEAEYYRPERELLKLMVERGMKKHAIDVASDIGGANRGCGGSACCCKNHYRIRAMWRGTM